MLFLIHFKIVQDKIMDVVNTFKGMTPEDDAKDAGPKTTCVTRLFDIGMMEGIVICDSPSSVEAQKWAFNWTSMCVCKIEPVVLDDQFRAILNEADKPAYSAPEPITYDDADGSIFYFKWSLKDHDKRAAAFDAFKQMDAAADEADAGACKMKIRVANVGMGHGVLVLQAKDSYDVQQWASNWCRMADIDAHVATNDAQTRAIYNKTA